MGNPSGFHNATNLSLNVGKHFDNMKYLRTLLIFLIIVSCQKNANKHAALGTWNYCTKAGYYEECIITNEFVLIMSTKPKKFFLLRNNIIDDNLVLSTIKGEINLPINNDTLVTTVQTKNKVILSSYYSMTNLELYKSEFTYDPIDWTNLESWKGKIKSEFRKRAELEECPDLRTEDEKTIPKLNIDLDNELEEEAPMKNKAEK
jgi:hypothetical protein